MKTGRSKPATVYLFGTCLVDAVYPAVGVAAIRLLRRAGVAVVFPRAQSCCGQPAYNAGYFDEARAVARAQLRAFDGPHPIVVPSGSCAGMMKIHYPALFAGPRDAERARRFAGRVFELSEFLVRVLGVRLVDRGDPLRVTWPNSSGSGPMARRSSFDFAGNVDRALADGRLRRNLRTAMDILVDKRRAVFDDAEALEQLRAAGGAVKRRALARLPELLERLETKCRANGIRVHWAETAEAANRTVLEILRAHGARSLVKGKSMVSEEMHP